MGRGRVAGPQFSGDLTWMRPSEVLPHADNRLDDPVQRGHVEKIAGSIQRRGYRAAQHESPYMNTGDTHIHLAHTDQGSFVMNGNHRVTAMGLIGYDKKVPVRVVDLRTKKDSP